MNDKKSFFWLDLLRGLAAMAVMAGHIRALTFIDYSPAQTGIAGKFFYFVTGFGHQAVIVFFVLSGFLITKSVDNAVKNEKWSVVSYIVDRMTRLWVVLIPALLFTVLFDRLGLAWFPDSMAYNGKISTLAGVDPAGKLGIGTFIGNTFFLQNICVETLGTNSPLWSLSFEFWYYCIFPMAFFALFRETKMSMRLILAVGSMLLLFFIGVEASAYFIIWLMGTGAYYVFQFNQEKKMGKTKLGIALLLFTLVLTFTRQAIYPVFFNDFSLGIVTAALVAVLCSQAMSSAILKYMSIFLSKISYTTYLLHMPLAVFFSSWMLQERQAWGAQTFGVYITIVLIVMCLCYLNWHTFEKNTYQVKNLIKLTLGKP